MSRAIRSRSTRWRAGWTIRGLDRNNRWTLQANADASLHHSVDHAMFAGETESHENIVNTLTLHDNTYIQYSKGALNVRATGDITWRRSEGKMYDFSRLSALDYRYGLSARYTLPRLNTTLSADEREILLEGCLMNYYAAQK